jgi:cytochrome c
MQRLVVMMFALFAATSALGQPKTDASIQRGQALVERNCGMCHATGTAGDSPNPLSPHFRDLHERYPVEDLGEALSEGIMVGHPQMPQFRFAPDEVQNIIAYLQSIQTRQHARLTTAPAG